MLIYFFGTLCLLFNFSNMLLFYLILNRKVNWSRTDPSRQALPRDTVKQETPPSWLSCIPFPSFWLPVASDPSHSLRAFVDQLLAMVSCYKKAHYKQMRRLERMKTSGREFLIALFTFGLSKTRETHAQTLTTESKYLNTEATWAPCYKARCLALV